MQVSKAVGPDGSAAPGHVVQFYDREAALAEELARFFRPVRRGEARGVAIVTPEHCPTIHAAAHGILVLDARSTLESLLVDGWPDAGRFEATVGAAVRRLAAEGPLCAFGEMVALLCRDGRPDAAIALERLWNVLMHEVGIKLLCAYPLGAFTPGGESAALAEHESALHPGAANGDTDGKEAKDAKGSARTAATRRRTSAETAALLAVEQLRRQELERELAAREAELRDFVANAPDGLHQIDADGTILWVNQAELDLLGYGRDEVVGRDVREFHEDPAVVDRIFAGLRAGTPVANQPARLRAKDGSLKDVLISSNAVRRDGRLWRSRCVVRDATALGRAQRQQAAVARLGALALAAELPELLDATARELASAYGAPMAAVAELLPGGRYRIAAGVGWRDGVLGAAQPMAAAPRAQGAHTLAADGPTVVDDLLAETRFTPAPLLLEHGARSSVTAVVRVRGRPWGTVGVLSPQPGRFGADAADFLAAVAHVLSAALERHGIEADLRAREQQQAAVARLGREAVGRSDLEALFAAAVREVAGTLRVECADVLQLDPDGHHLAVRAGHGWRPGLVGKARVPAGPGSQAGSVLLSKGPLVYHGLRKETRFAPSALLLDHGCHSGMAVAVETRAGAFGMLGAHTAQPRRFSADDANFLSAVAHVLASAIERAAVEDDLQRSRVTLEETVADRTRQLAASNRELEAFSYSVSHDLRAPLRTISGYASLLEAKHGAELAAPAHELLQGVRKGADRLGHLIDDLLDLSRVQRVDLERKAVDLSALANARLRELGAAEPDRRVEVRVEAGLRVTGDPSLLGMLLDNLLGNAWKFTRHAERARVEVGRQGRGADAVFFVRDNGAGFDMAYAGRLFQPFQRLHRPSEFEGSGVGLATVQRIVDRHGGRVWAEGRVGEGAAFYFTLGG